MHHFCGYYIVCCCLILKVVSVFPKYWRIDFYIACIPSSIRCMRWNNKFCEKLYMFFKSVDSWRLMFLWPGCSTEFCLPFLKHRKHSPGFKVLFLFTLQCCFRFCSCQWLPWDLYCIWKLQLVRFDFFSGIPWLMCFSFFK